MQAVDTALIHALPIVEVAWCGVKISAGWPIALTLEPVTSSALGLVEFCRHLEVGRTLRRHRDVISVDDASGAMGKRGHLRTWTLVLNERDKLLRLTAEAGLAECTGSWSSSVRTCWANSICSSYSD